MIHILYTFLSKKCYDEALSEQLKMFPKAYGEKIYKFRRWQDQQASVFGRMLLLRGLATYFDIQMDASDILINDDRKPYIKHPTIEFNISHSGDMVICCISKKQVVGIDVEHIREIEISDFFSQMTDFEKNTILHSDDPKQAFYEYWTQKEAVIKANGKGLSIPLKSFEVIQNQTQLQQEVWHVSKLNIHPEYSCHIATPTVSTYKIHQIASKELRSDYKNNH